MIEINGQSFKVGDTVHFARATLPDNRVRDYRITAVTDAGIEAAAGGFTYSFTRATATRIGITHAADRDEDWPWTTVTRTGSTSTSGRTTAPSTPAEAAPPKTISHLTRPPTSTAS